MRHARVARPRHREGVGRRSVLALRLVGARGRDRQRRVVIADRPARARRRDALGEDSVTVKASSLSIALSPATLMVMSLEVSPAAKLTLPVGRAPPLKSSPLTAAPETA
jgi:hypothetical protein